MVSSQDIEKGLEDGLELIQAGGCPPRLAAALRHALFPGGGRIRPRLCLAVAGACGADAPALAMASAVALEMLHCASLVHDDMPCFDDAPLRRGRPSVHAAFGEDLALLAGDGLIAGAFQVLCGAGHGHPERHAALCSELAQGIGAGQGLIAGQAWETESVVDMETYHRAKTGALFAASMAAGALASGAEAGAWREAGLLLGQAYQVADDVADASGDAQRLGKPVGQDESHERPNAVQRLGLAGAVRHIDELLARSIQALPREASLEELEDLLEQVAHRLCPPDLRARLAEPPSAEKEAGE